MQEIFSYLEQSISSEVKSDAFHFLELGRISGTVTLWKISPAAYSPYCQFLKIYENQLQKDTKEFY